jgi:hypothetical protein
VVDEEDVVVIETADPSVVGVGLVEEEGLVVEEAVGLRVNTLVTIGAKI